MFLPIPDCLCVFIERQKRAVPYNDKDTAHHVEAEQLQDL